MEDDQLPKRLQQWLENNKDAIRILGKKIREIDTCREGQKYPEDARRIAIEIVEGWIREVYDKAWTTSEMFYPEEEDTIIRYLDKPVN